MKCGRVSCAKFRSLDCGHDVEPDERCEYYVNNGLPIPDCQKEVKVAKPAKDKK